MYHSLSAGPSSLLGSFRRHRVGWLIPPSQINLDIDCVQCECVWGRERQCLIETEPVGLVIYCLFRSSFPRVHSSLPSTRRQGAKPLLFPPRWSNSSSLRKGKGSLCLPQQVQRQLIFITSLWSAPSVFLIFDLLCGLCDVALFLCFIHTAEKGKGSFTLTNFLQQKG